MKNKISLKETLERKDLKDLREFALSVLNMGDEVNEMALETLVEKIADNFHKDVFAAATHDFVMTELDLENYFLKMIQNGEARIPKTDDEAVEVFKRMVFVNVREVKCGRGTTFVASLAAEVHVAILAEFPRYKELRYLKDNFYLYANSAAVLYGVVTLKELCDLYRRWNPDAPLTEKIARMVLDYTQTYEETEFFFDGDRVCNLELNVEENQEKLIAAFIAERDSHSRWYPESEEKFIGFCCESAHLETDEARALDAFLRKHGLTNFEKRGDVLYEIIYKHQIGEKITAIISSLSMLCQLKDESDVQEFISVLGPFLNTMHLRILNGWSPDTLHELLSTPAVRTKPHVGRNDPCPCGSGLKYKKCCGRDW